MKYSPLVAAIIGAVMLVLQQYIGQPSPDLKVIGFAALIAAIGAAGSFLKGKGLTVGGIAGTVLYTFYNVYQSGTFTWNEFILSAVVALLALFSPQLTTTKE